MIHHIHFEDHQTHTGAPSMSTTWTIHYPTPHLSDSIDQDSWEEWGETPDHMHHGQVDMTGPLAITRQTALTLANIYGEAVITTKAVWSECVADYTDDGEDHGPSEDGQHILDRIQDVDVRRIAQDLEDGLSVDTATLTLWVQHPDNQDNGRTALQALVDYVAAMNHPDV